MKKSAVTQQKILTLPLLESKLAYWHFRQYKIVFTNGCFDLLHIGHLHTLQEAADLGDILIVGLNTDASVKRLKGESRPLNSENNRATILAALHCIDYVILFDEDTPYNLIQKLQPDILVKGGDYQKADIIGAEIVEKKGGQVHTIPLIPDISTTKLINKSQN